MSFSEFLNKRRGAAKPIASVCCSLMVAALCGCSADSERFSEWGWSNGASYRDRDRDAALPDAGPAASDADGYRQRRAAGADAPPARRPASLAGTADYGTLFTMAEADGDQVKRTAVEQEPGHVNNAGTVDDDPKAEKKTAKRKHRRRTRRRHRANSDDVARQTFPPVESGGGYADQQAGAPYNGAAPAHNRPNMRYAAPFAGQPSNTPYNPAAYGNEGYRGGAPYQGAPAYGRAPSYRGAPARRQAPAPQGGQPYPRFQAYSNVQVPQPASEPQGGASQPMAYGYQVNPNYYGPPRRGYFGGVNAEKPTGANARVHVVERGETIYSIARKYGVGMGELTAINRLSSTTLSIGQTLIIPDSVASRSRHGASRGRHSRRSQGRGVQAHNSQGDAVQGRSAPPADGRDQGGGWGYNRGQGYGGPGHSAQNYGAQNGYSDPAAGNQNGWRGGYQNGAQAQTYPRQAYDPQYAPGQNYGQGYGAERPADYGRESYPYDGQASGGWASSEHEREGDKRSSGRSVRHRHRKSGSNQRRAVKMAAVKDADRRETAGVGHAGKEGVYVVKRGDTIYQIARRHGVSSRTLTDLNELDPLEYLRIGQKLQIPESGAAEPPSPKRRRGKGRAKAAAADADGRDEAGSQRGASAPSASSERRDEEKEQADGGRAPANAAEREAGGGRENSASATGPQDDPASRTALLTNEKARRSAAGSRTERPAPTGAKAASGHKERMVASARPANAPVKPGVPERATEAVPAARAAPDVKECEALLEHPMARSSEKFREPVRGKVISQFGANKDGTHNDGVNFMVPAGTVVKAAENGVVAYAGNELSGFGNLILIRHADGYVTAYAHNEKLLVKRCEVVKRGQPIARSGSTGAAPRPQLHFEIRKDSKPVDPVQHIARM
jgi:murein DD-endopeptidase MepM/ murein hydrolase activator NlpD